MPKTGILAETFTHERLWRLRRMARNWLNPVAKALHQAQVFTRHLPDSARKPLDQLGVLASLPGLLIESTCEDLREAMQEAEIGSAVVVAYPPYSSNEFVLECCQEDSSLFAAVNIPHGTFKPGSTFKKYVRSGARLLKINAPIEGEPLDSLHYRTLLKTASALGIPVILQTGRVHANLFKDPSLGDVERYVPWLKKFPQVRFILAHMNIHEPVAALDIAQKFENTFVDTSWQPTEIIGEAVRRIGAERVLFASDWPLIGQNLSIGIKRVHDCLEAEMIQKSDAALILGGNARKLLRLELGGS